MDFFFFVSELQRQCFVEIGKASDAENLWVGFWRVGRFGAYVIQWFWFLRLVSVLVF